ncbi:phage late control D family protein [Kaustia mangrovi]|uniref:Phage late control D family protein n=1 Tax=Kaustia mangrovi TaxID=2593653 RepID=A0A7S8C754_9HYPH|nr:contractile injection system protein, VgrG/Pvc8 family [Kaustia mangrovi]QPC44645.1 phage late control D family protein [Kaustia mangrovi]
MTPAFRVFADGADATAPIADRLLELTVTDSPGMEADEVALRIDDRGHRVALPRRGAGLRVQLGYLETGLADMGLYTVDEVEVEGPPWTIGVRGRSADMRESFKEQKSRHWEETTLGDVVGKIAGEHGLAAAVDPAIADRPIPYFAQTAESDLHFVTRLARRHGAIAKPAGGALVVTTRGSGRTGSGMAIPALTVRPGDVSTVRATLRDRPAHRAVQADWQDRARVSREPVIVGEGEPKMILPHVYPDEEEARRAAQARARELDTAKGRLSVEMPGATSIVAERQVALAGFRDGLDGVWTVTRAEHVLDGNGYQTRFEAEAGKET